jgi:hypothetical protein
MKIKSVSGRCTGILFALLLAQFATTSAQHIPTRTEVRIPDVGGYRTLKCDFHIHTVFSDGRVWPDVRVEEAWREGLDAIAITDHLEVQPHRADLPTNHNRAYEIAKTQGEVLGVTVIRGSEITRSMPPGHLNAIFLEASDVLAVEDWHEAAVKAHNQGAFVFWNHPAWKRQQPDGLAKWYKEHEKLLEEGILNGIEVVNEREYSPEAHRWCMERKLTMLGDSDIHYPLNLDYEIGTGDHRPMTLVFATDNTPRAIKEALIAHRTAVYSGNRLIGDEKFLRPIFESSIQVKSNQVKVNGKRRSYIQIANRSDVSFELEGAQPVEGVQVPDLLILPKGRTVLVEITGTSKERAGEQRLSLPYAVRNLVVAPAKGLPVNLELLVKFIPES